MFSRLKKTYTNFSEARNFAHSLGLKSRAGWEEWVKSNELPTDIPKHPSRVYAKKGWISWGDFLGTGKIANQKKIYRSFEEAGIYARALNMKSQAEWRNWLKKKEKPADIPANPSKTYSKEWQGWGDFLGTGQIANQHRIFRSFEDARAFARRLGFKMRDEWIVWAKTNARPDNIPAYPNETYANNGWNGWVDFLGANRIDKRPGKHRPFEETRIFARSLGFRSVKEWEQFVKSGQKPIDIPVTPHQVYAKKGWISYGDFLGADIVASQNRTYRPFGDARTYARKLNLKKITEWEKWADSERRPSDIPKQPHHVYRDSGWIDYGDFLGTEIVANQNRKYRQFSDARRFAHTLKLKSSTKWQEWTKTADKPSDIPSNPSDVYKEEWEGWGDFLGTNAVANQDKVYRSFEKARKFAQQLGLKSKDEWAIWAKTANKPSDVPSSPSGVYKKQWEGWGDFLGTKRIANQKKQFLPFAEAREYARSLGLPGKKDWEEWTKSDERPDNIPAYPNETYEKKGWCGWGDWLGVTNNWNLNNIRAFVMSILPHIDNFSPAGLYVLFQQTGILEIGRNNRGRAFVQALKTGRFPKEELEKFVAGEQSLVDEFFVNSEISLDEQEEMAVKDSLVSEERLSEDEALILKDLPSVDTQGILATLDCKLFSTLDKEAIDFFIKEAVARIWQCAFLDEATAVKQLEQYSDQGVYSQEVKRLFLHDYHGAKNLQIPDGYNFPHQPLLMQLYTAYLIKTRKRLGNWSGTGAGKTLSAILASRVIKARLTVICCPNNVVSNWKRNILEIYPESSVFIKDTYIKKDISNKPRYLILNYEFYQQPKAERELKTLLDTATIDFVIIDEIHYSKQREVERISLRKAAISAFLSEASARNVDLHVLGMSATPIINNLLEGKTLIEMVTGVHHDDLNTKSTVPNCIAHYQKFVSHGIRWLPKYNYQLNLKTERIDCSRFLSEIKRQNIHGSMVDLEAVLTKAKLPYILDSLKPKTIVYTHYVKDILAALQEAIKNKGWLVGVFTGENKDGLDAFIEGNVDILIASSCVGTGVDRLQHVCNRLIINSLPWTHAEFEQLKGRIYRQGQIKDHVDVLVPLTYADVNGEEWSWCDSRWKRIQFKKSVSDAAVDGIIPEGHLRTPAQAYKDTMIWLERLDRGELYEIERRKISIPLIGEIKPNVQRRMGDLSQMNSRINHAPSCQTHQRFRDHPNEWACYHSVYREDRKSWPVIPYEEAIKWFKARPHMVIGDFGCGEALLAANVENKVFSFDHVAINEQVIACDMCHTSLDDACLDAAVFSLSLMGSNFVDYLKEAHRCLKLDGHLWIAEPTSRIKDTEVFRDLLFRLGFDVSRIDEKWKFTFIKAIKSERELNQKALDSLSHISILA